MNLWKIGSCIESRMELDNLVTKCRGGAKCPWLLRTFIGTFLNPRRNHRESEWNYQSWYVCNWTAWTAVCEKLTAAQRVSKGRGFYKTLGFMTVFTRAHHVSLKLEWDESGSNPHILVSLTSILILYILIFFRGASKLSRQGKGQQLCTYFSSLHFCILRVSPISSESYIIFKYTWTDAIFIPLPLTL
jgi:hypothetical protein